MARLKALLHAPALYLPEAIMSDNTDDAPILLSAASAARLLSVSLRQFHNLRKAAGFPAPIPLGPRSTRWVRSELQTYLVSMPRGEAHEPAPLAAARAAQAAGRPLTPEPFGAAHAAGA